MTSVQSRSCSHQTHFSISAPDISSPPESKLFKQSARLLGPESPTAISDVPKYSEDDLQRILKAVLEARASTLAPALAPALAASKKPQDKLLKAWFPDVYCEKSHMYCYNFRQ